jgi:4-hydroxyphenylpyruvate dioxygenase
LYLVCPYIYEIGLSLWSSAGSPKSLFVTGTLREIRARSSLGGFELLPPPPPRYYDGLRQLAGDVLSEEQIKECQELGVLVDRDDHGGVVLQVFTKAA